MERITHGSYFCVLCGVAHNEDNGLETCPESELSLSHLWAQDGHKLPWFKYIGVGLKAPL